ncbi:MAG: mobile mystery protein B [Bdellovibrionota bacterium]
MKDPFKAPLGATLLDPDEAEALIPSSISTQSELNEAEQANILKARNWTLKMKRREILSDLFVRLLHKKMFSQVWRWAGHYRTTEKNIGIAPHQIAVATRDLCSDAAVWIKNQVYDWDELGARFHHRLVSIHPFANGNGRHARLMTDVLLQHHGQEPFRWGSTEEDVRAAYLRALRDADGGKFEELILFSKS